MITVAEILNAIDKNGLVHVRGRWEEFDGDELESDVLIGGCALTQAAYNLNLGDPLQLEVDLSSAVKINAKDGTYGLPVGKNVGLGQLIISLNDNTKEAGPDDSEGFKKYIEDDSSYRSLNEITGYIRETYPEILSEEVPLDIPVMA